MKTFYSILLAVIATPLLAAPPVDKAWTSETEFVFLSASGNSQSRTLGAGEKLRWGGDVRAVELWGNALNVESDGSRTSERYDAGQKYERRLSDRNYAFERFLWESNRFAGFRHRYDGSLGLGRSLVKTDAQDLAMELGGGYINEQRIDSPRIDFGTGRGYLKYVRTFSAASSFSQDGEYLHNFDDPNGYRVNAETALTAGVSTYVSLKLSFQWKHVHQPPEGFKRDDTLTLISLLVNY